MTRVLQCANVSRTFPGAVKVKALIRADFTADAGELIAILGRSGSGKSTLLNLIGLLDTPTTGEIELQGVASSRLSSRARAKLRAHHLGFVFQSFHLIPELTAMENVAVALAYRGGIRRQRLALAADALTAIGLGHRLDAKARTLSGGEQQRVALARAIVHQPAMVLADEPTGNLDSITEGTVMSMLGEIAHQGRTVLVVTHSPTVAAAAHRCLHVRDGVLVQGDRD